MFTKFTRRIAVSICAISGLMLSACASSSNPTTQPTVAAMQPATPTVPATPSAPTTPTVPAIPATPAAPAVASNLPTIRIKAGSTEDYKDVHGNLWMKDTGFTGGDVTDRDAAIAISGTDDPAFYHTEHYSMDSFSYPLPNGKYIVNLRFAETYDDEASGPGTRVFSFTVAGKEFKDFDVFAKAGGVHKAYVESVPVEITNGKLDITFTAGVQNPEINGIEILPAS
jgi:hypothetical protein